MNEGERVIQDLMAERKVEFEHSTRTGVLSLDLVLGGSLPSGPVEIYGDSGTGKTSLLYQTLAQAQRDNYVTALCQSEYLDVSYMKDLGIDLNHLCIITKNNAEAVFEAALVFLSNCTRAVLAIDSATAFRPQDDSPGHWNELIESFLLRVSQVLDSQSCVLMINQVRVPPSLNLDRSKFFAGTTDSAARKIASHFATRLELSRTEVTDDRYSLVVNIVSNTLAPPGMIVELPFTKGQGVNRELDYVRRWLTAKPGGWYEIDGEMIHGEEAAAAKIRENPDDMENRIGCSLATMQK